MAEVPAPFGKYYLTEKLAAGGMAEIYLGKLVGPGGFEKLLVIKQIHPRFSGQRHFVDLFVAEAKTLVGLVHGNIVPVYELGVIGATYYIAMEYIDGPSLYRLTEQLRAARTTMAPALAAHLTAKILDGLDYAHRKGEGVIHRDLSSRNVMLSRDGEVKLVDFGIAVALGDAGDHAGDLPAGSFPYMSPEQVRREPLTGQSDLFSTGILLWEMLTGERLFAREDALATMRAVTDAVIPPPSQRNPAVPSRLDEVVMKALARDPAERWRTAADMLAALHRYSYSLAVTPGARELSQLVSRYCPPTVRRHHTDAGIAPRQEDELAATPPSAPASDPAGPSTAVMQRTPGSQVRQQAFATHVELVGLFPEAAAGGAPRELAAKEALENDDPDAATSVAVGRAKPEISAAAKGSAGAGEPPPSAEPDEPLSGRPTSSAASPSHAAPTTQDAPPPAQAAPVPLAQSRPMAARLLAVVLVAAAMLGAVALWQRADRRHDPATGADGGAALATADASSLAELDAASTRDASVVLDAGPDATARLRDATTARDAGHDASTKPPRPDAKPPRPDARPTRDAGFDASAKPVLTATIRVGANPWGEVFLDGRAAGRTPLTLPVAPGRHEIEVLFPVDTPPRRETFRIEVGDGETRSVLADFSR